VVAGKVKRLVCIASNISVQKLDLSLLNCASLQTPMAGVHEILGRSRILKRKIVYSFPMRKNAVMHLHTHHMKPLFPFAHLYDNDAYIVFSSTFPCCLDKFMGLI
jgi:hypothetical protein